MDRDLYQNWLESLDIDEIINLADDWGNQVANYSAMGGEELKRLQTFSQYLIDHYNGAVASDPGYGDSDANDQWHDDLDRSGE